MKDSLLIALGGNAIVGEGEEGNLGQQYKHARETMSEIADLLLKINRKLIITHGNGPQVGNIVFRSEIARPYIYPLTLDVCVSDSEGGMGYMFQQLFYNEIMKRGVKKDIVTIITQTVVDKNDKAFINPTKFIGQPHSKEKAEAVAKERNWIMKEEKNGSFRRVVPSPAPIKIIEEDIIRKMIGSGIIVIAAGGGGIPVIQNETGELFGIDAVVDKDLASALLARLLGIETFIILTGVEKVAINYRKPNEKLFDKMTLSEAKKYLGEGHFPPGNMGPKIQAAIEFLEGGGKTALITQPGRLLDALNGKTGTLFTTD